MSVDFETKCEQHALDYIKIHLREGYFVNAYVGKGTYYWEKVYKIHAYLKDEPTEREGEWIYKDDPIFAGKYYCNNCDSQAEVDLYGEWILSDYCPHCGAKMKRADRKTEPQTIRCPKCGRSNYIREFGKDFSVTAEEAGFKYKCINCNTYIEPQSDCKTENSSEIPNSCKDEPQTERSNE